MAKQRKTYQPSGLTLTRNGAKFTATWKCADKNYNDGQSLGWRTFQPKKTKWTWPSIAASARSYSWTVDPKKYYPYTKTYLNSVQYGIAGNCGQYEETVKGKKVKRNPTKSKYSQKAFALAAPGAPTMSNETSDQYTNVRTYKWSYAVNATNSQWFTDVEWQTILVKESNVTDGSKLAWNNKALGWGTGSGGAEGSRTLTEDTTLLAAASYTRWFRARCRGPRGASAWRYTKHVFAKPFAAVISDVKATNIAGGYRVTVTWKNDQTAAHPTDETNIQYLIATPIAGLGCPATDSWTDVNTIKDTGGNDAYTFEVPTRLGEDEALFVRVNTTHDANITHGAPKLAKMGWLADPSGLSASINESTRKATITCTNNSDVPDSFIAVRYCTAADPDGFVVAIIPHGQTSVTNVQCPAAKSTDVTAFTAQAIVGSYTKTTRADGVSTYALVRKALSENIIRYGGAIPVAPTEVTVQATDILGTVRVTWDSPWEDATAAELSWADHEDAWESTDEPSTYTVDSTNASRWNISGLKTGITWYFRVRLVQESGDDEVFGPYSETVTIDLSSAPAIPQLSLSERIITESGSLTASWVYSTTDGTAQASAELALVTGEAGSYGYQVIASVGGAQYVALSAEELGWRSGETYMLAVRVTSGSGHVSDAWSNPVSVTIAEPLTCAITQTSLEEAEVEPRDYSGELVTFDNTSGVTAVDSLVMPLTPKQSLNGYDRPWAGGAGKNKLPNNGTTSTIYGVTYTVNDDGSVATSGTATGRGNFWLIRDTDLFKAGTTYKAVCLNASASLMMCLGIAAPGNAARYIDVKSNDPVSFTVNEGEVVGVYMRVSGAGVVANATLYPMILADTETDYTWAPYANVCPISGYDSVSVVRCGKNLAINNEWTDGTTAGITYTMNEDGSITANGTATAKTARHLWQISTDDYMLLPVGQYILTGGAQASSNMRVVTTVVRASGVISYIEATSSSEKPFTVNDGDRIGAIYVRPETGAVLNNVTLYPMIRPASIADATYEPYQPTTYTVNLSDAAGTVYGGTLDVVSGELVVDKKSITYDGAETWAGANGTASGYMRVGRLLPDDAKKSANNNSTVGAINNEYTEVTANQTWGGTIGFSVDPSGYIHVCQTGEKTMVVDDWRTWLASNPMQVVYPLATPATYQLTPTQVDTLLGVNTLTSDVSMNVHTNDGKGATLTVMPLTVTAVGAGAGGTTKLIVERAETYHSDRPDERDFNGFEGETVAILSQTGESQMTVTLDDLLGRLDDEATYRIIATVEDGLGQSAEASKRFTVRWAHQAIMPEVTVSTDAENRITRMTPIAPSGWAQGDVCDIYRLSVDRPELIVEGATFGTEYVDPYPAIGEYGGHRFVFRTINGDYITEDGRFAWVDTREDDGDRLDSNFTLIDFPGGTVELLYNVDVSNDWSKDFKETKYLGGSVQGDWNVGVSRTASVSSVMITLIDAEQIELMRRLAVYAGICHVRTQDGSSYAADVQVSESYSHDTGSKIASFSLSITRVDPEGYDGMTYAVWEESQ